MSRGSHSEREHNLMWQSEYGLLSLDICSHQSNLYSALLLINIGVFIYGSILSNPQRREVLVFLYQIVFLAMELLELNGFSTF